MQSVQQEAAMANARNLIDVRLEAYLYLPFCIRDKHLHMSLKIAVADPSPENQQHLLRALRPQSFNFTIEQRADLPHTMHGEVYGIMELGIESIRAEITAGAESETDAGRYWFDVGVMTLSRKAKEPK